MKKLYSVLAILCCMTFTALSQGPPQRPMAGVLEAMKRDFITRRLNLSPGESQRFWPIYDYYAADMRQAYKLYRAHNNEIELDENILSIKKKYSVEFLKALSPGKINDFFHAEKDFNAYVRKEIQRRQMQGRPIPSPGY